MNKEANKTTKVQQVHDEIFLGLDVHADHIRVVRQIDGSNPQPAQRYTWEKLPSFVQKQLQLARKVYAVYETGAFGFNLQRDIQTLGATCYVTKATKLDPNHRGVQTDKTDALELVGKLERYVHGNKRALVSVRVPTPEEEARRATARHRKYLFKQA